MLVPQSLAQCFVEATGFIVGFYIPFPFIVRNFWWCPENKLSCPVLPAKRPMFLIYKNM
jgi:hypothetical protein